MELLLAFIIGSVLGSFLNVVIDRLSTGRGIVGGRSYCEHCKKTLSPIDLIPIFSYLFLGGKCRFCKKNIPKRLILVESLTGVTFALVIGFFMTQAITFLAAIFLALILWCFIGIFFADVEYGIIPDLLVILSTVGSIAYLYEKHISLTNHLYAGLASLLFFLVLFTITKGRGMGFGDVKFSFVLGFLLGFPSVIVALYIAFLTGALVSIILVIWRKLHFFGSTIPFGPFLVVSVIISLFWGEKILQIFISHFL